MKYETWFYFLVGALAIAAIAFWGATIYFALHFFFKFW